MKTERSTRSLPCQINSLTLIVCLYYVNFVAKINKLELELELDECNCNCNYILFTKLPSPGDSEGTFRSSSQAATCPSVYHTRWRLHTAPLIAERQAGKL